MIYFPNEYFDPAKIAASGQCFRWQNLDGGEWLVPAFGTELHIGERGGDIALDCSQDEFERIWKSYLDIESDYGAYHRAALNSELPYLITAAEYSKGIRILRQDLWETVLSFIISQNNNIPRIRLCLNRIIERFGHLPEPSEIAEGTLDGLGLGYRDRYIYDAAKRLTPDMTDFRSIVGVGPKVANCIELYGLGRKDAFPRDVWIKRIEKEHFNGRFPEELFPGFAGVMQQYLFYYGKSGGQ
ncbi:MAG: DNA-3-methyladenine glycosylase 2 family protein [Oscillospiraceae bacterium]|jgi:N-glycosylase/DNA lyase|nr:DNA-3-methyladenine glycosylase 2 family protein [Oscillospiraceae bacterium]